MKTIVSLLVVPAFALAFAIPAIAQDKASSMQKQIVGTYALVSAENTHSDGKKSQPFGPNGKGMAMFSANGRFMILNTNPGTPKFAANSRSNGTAEENKAAMAGAIALFGTYKVDEKAKTMTWNVEASNYPNWNGTEQKRPINSLTADQLSYTNPAASTGGATTLLVWKRIK